VCLWPLLVDSEVISIITFIVKNLENILKLKKVEVKSRFGIPVVGGNICHKGASKWTCQQLPPARRQNLGSGWDRFHESGA
jgi:hypothetical protein